MVIASIGLQISYRGEFGKYLSVVRFCLAMGQCLIQWYLSYVLTGPHPLEKNLVAASSFR